MEQQLFIILFFTGVLPLVLSVPRKYYLINQGKTWSDAQAYCRANYVDLATFDNEAEQIKLYNEAQKQQFTAAAWIGLYKIYHEWRWSYGNMPSSLSSWCSGEPNNGAGSEECAALDSQGWWDGPCTYLIPFMCFDDRLTGNSRYIYYSIPKTWHDAQFTCRVNHTDLANTANPTELSVVKSKIPGGSAWIGLHWTSWKWSDQTDTSIIWWYPGQPDNALYNENCGYLYNGQAADAPCSFLKPFFCYRIITGQQQIIRVKVQSDQDVNDPAVKAAILEKIQQVLLKYGVRNIKLKWRKQPDGVEIRKIPLKKLP